MNNSPYLIVDDASVIKEIYKIDEQVKEELGKPNYDKEKVMKLRFEQLLKGIYLTQDPNAWRVNMY